MPRKYILAGDYERLLDELAEARAMLTAIVSRYGRHGTIHLGADQLAVAGKGSALRTSRNRGGVRLTVYELVADEATLEALPK